MYIINSKLTYRATKLTVVVKVQAVDRSLTPIEMVIFEIPKVVSFPCESSGAKHTASGENGDCCTSNCRELAGSPKCGWPR